MKHSVLRFRSMKLALEHLEPFIRDGAHLQTGKPISHFGGLRSREILASWLLCVAMSADGRGDYYFTTDPTGGDGVICEASSELTWRTEHVMVPELSSADTRPVESRIIEMIQLKVDKGLAYADGKTLVVFSNTNDGAWTPNRVAHQLPSPLHFDTVWVMGLQGVVDDAYVYGVANLDTDGGSAPVWRIAIAPDFGSWSVERLQ